MEQAVNVLHLWNVRLLTDLLQGSHLSFRLKWSHQLLRFLPYSDQPPVKNPSCFWQPVPGLHDRWSPLLHLQPRSLTDRKYILQVPFLLHLLYRSVLPVPLRLHWLLLRHLLWSTPVRNLHPWHLRLLLLLRSSYSCFLSIPELFRCFHISYYTNRSPDSYADQPQGLSE